MRAITPEIAWHETLPIYSCDLQNHAGLSSNSNFKPTRFPLAEIHPTKKPCTDSPQDPSWTRLATAGGDNVVRLWRVYLRDWSASSQNISIYAPTKKVTIDSASEKCAETEAPEHLIYLASLKRHEKPVNAVRWSPSGQFLASAGDDLFIFIWSKQPSHNVANPHDCQILTKEDEDYDCNPSCEHWVPCRSLRRHLEDIYDLCWSPDECAIISGSVDHSIIVWQLDLSSSLHGQVAPNTDLSTNNNNNSDNNNNSGENVSSNHNKAVSLTPVSSDQPSQTIQVGIKSLIIRDHKHYVQGVVWDPLGFYVASLSSDRACRIYRAGTRNCVAHVSKSGKQRLFQDDSWKSFFRRLTFSPDGLMLICPSGNLEENLPASNIIVSSAATGSDVQPNISKNQTNESATTSTGSVAPQHAAHIFLRSNFTRPIVSLPTGSRPVVSVRFCPQPFQLRQINTGQDSCRRTLFDLPYRWLFCLVLEDGLLFYDTQQMLPFAQVSQIHYQALNDACWSQDGRLVVVCSTDGYCSLIQFCQNELGQPYVSAAGTDNFQTPSDCLMNQSHLDDNKDDNVSTSTNAFVTGLDVKGPHSNGLDVRVNANTIELDDQRRELGSETITESVKTKITSTNINLMASGSTGHVDQVVTPIRKRRVAFRTLTSSIIDGNNQRPTASSSDKQTNNSQSNQLQITADVCTKIQCSGEEPTTSSSHNNILTPKRRVSFVTLCHPVSDTHSVSGNVHPNSNVTDALPGKIDFNEIEAQSNPVD